MYNSPYDMNKNRDSWKLFLPFLGSDPPAKVVKKEGDVIKRDLKHVLNHKVEKYDK